jgi:hypothetical protein
MIFQSTEEEAHRPTTCTKTGSEYPKYKTSGGKQEKAQFAHSCGDVTSASTITFIQNVNVTSV